MNQNAINKSKLIEGALVLMSVVFALIACHSVKPTKAVNAVVYEREKVIFGYEDDTTLSSDAAGRSDTNLVVLTFFEKFNDTITVYFNGVEKGRWLIHQKNNPNTSSGYSGIDIGILFTKRDNSQVILRMENQKKLSSLDF